MQPFSKPCATCVLEVGICYRYFRDLFHLGNPIIFQTIKDVLMLVPSFKGVSSAPLSAIPKIVQRILVQIILLTVVRNIFQFDQCIDYRMISLPVQYSL